MKKATVCLVLLILLAFAVRVSIISYGLPLWLINDEPSTILGALKMMELKSLIPAFHLKEMTSVLYYPPYISYLYVIPFSIVFLLQYIHYGVDLQTLGNILASDLSIYFVVARMISIAFGLGSLILVYKTSTLLFKSKKAALFSVFLGATSLIHIALSVSARHWIFISFIYSLALYILSLKKLSPGKKYFIYYLVASLGMGISSIALLLFALPPLWHFYKDRKPLNDLGTLLKKKTLYAAVALIAFFCLLPSLLYPSGNGFLVDITSNTGKSLLQALLSPLLLIQRIAGAELALVLLGICGLLLILKRFPRVGHIFCAFIYGYALVFYFMFRFESRFVLPFLPFILILAGYGAFGLWQKNFALKITVIVILILPLAGSMKLVYVGHKNDSRVHAIEWAYGNLASADKIITFGSQVRLPATKEALKELGAIDPTALRKIDTSEGQLETGSFQRFSSLNIYNVHNENFLAGIRSYAKNNGYKYLIEEKSDSELGKAVEALANKNAELLTAFGEKSVPFSLATSEFNGTLFEFLQMKEFGPRISIYKLQQ